MDILLVAATPFEIIPVQDWFRSHFSRQGNGVFRKNDLSVSVLVTGVGVAATAWSLGQSLARKQPDLAIQAGIAGSFDPAFQLGDVVHVVSERFGDLGVEEADGRFTDLFDLNLLDAHEKPYVNGLLYNPAASESRFLAQAKGLTVNKVHGSESSISAIRKKYPDAQVESMEGAAFFHACLMTGVPFMEIRSISNQVEPRNRENWKLELAIDNLNNTLVQILEGF
jgi:futalosine hydrolase